MPVLFLLETPWKWNTQFSEITISEILILLYESYDSYKGKKDAVFQ